MDTMNKFKMTRVLIILFCSWLLPVFGHAQSCDPITRPQLKEKLVQMGFEVNTISDKAGEEKYSVSHPGTGFNIPIGYEISPSTNFIWLTTNLGKAENITDEKSMEMIKENGKIQPCFFYITSSGIVMMALAVENRGVTAAVLRRHIDKIVADVSKTSAIWQVK
jgi:hypothetical protein